MIPTPIPPPACSDWSRAYARSESPRARVYEWLQRIGADHIVFRDGRSETTLSVRYALDRLANLAPDVARIDSFGLRVVAARRGETVAILHTPTYDGHIIRWEKIA